MPLTRSPQPYASLSRAGNLGRWGKILPRDVSERVRQDRRWAWRLRAKGHEVELIYELPRATWIKILERKGLL